MAYTESGGFLKYFIPNIPLATTTAGVLREIDIGASSADHGEWICVKDCIVRRYGFTVVGELAGGTSAAPTVIFTKRPTPLSATGEAVLSTLTIPDATAVGASIYSDATNDAITIGDSIEISHTVGTGTPTGKGFAWWICEDDPEYVGNNTGLTASA